MELPEARGHHHLQGGLDNLAAVVLVHSFEVPTNAFDDGLILAVVDVDAAHVLFKDHLGNVKRIG